jgi:Tfp pilus assembly protein PilW
MNRHRPQFANPARGTSILEFVVYVGIIGLVLVTATMFMVEVMHSGAKVDAGAEAAWNGRFAVSRVAAEIREATGLNVGTSVFGSHPGTLSLATGVPATDPTVFSVVGGALVMQQGAGPALPLTNSKVEVTEFLVDNVSAVGRTRAVRLRLVTKAKNADVPAEQRAEVPIETTVRLQLNDGFGN